MAFSYKVQKGDTLNAIANRFGFKNYKDAGITSVSSGNFDLITPGEDITLTNYDPNKIQGFNSGQAPFVVSSLDPANQFTQDKNKLDEIVARTEQATVADQQNKDLQKELETKAKAGDNSAQKGLVANDTKDQRLSEIAYLDDEKKNKEAKEKMEQDKADYLSLLAPRFASIDSISKASIDRITASTQRQIEERARINQINTDRVIAYGKRGSLYSPIMFSDAVSERERKGAEDIQRLERERDVAIAEAMASAEKNRQQLLEVKMKNINEIEDKLRTRLQQIEAESEKQYQTLRTLRKEEEDKRLKIVEEQKNKLRAFVALNKDTYADLTPDQMKTRIEQDMLKYGLSMSDALTSIQKALEVDYKIEKDKLAIEKDKADIAYKKQQTATEAQRTKKEGGLATKAQSGESAGEEYTTTEKKKLEQVGLQDATRAHQLDYLFGDEDAYETKYGYGKEETSANLGKKQATQSTGSLKSRLNAMGIDYDALKNDGYTDEEIEKEVFGG